MTVCGNPLSRLLLGAKRTCPSACARLAKEDQGRARGLARLRFVRVCKFLGLFAR